MTHLYGPDLNEPHRKGAARDARSALGATIEMVRAAIKGRNVMLAYQPIVHSKNPTRPAYYEGLIRVLDAKRRIIPASDFIGAIETMETGRILDCLSLELGLQALAEEPSLRLAINMSARSIGYPRWMETLNRGLALDKTVAERLILEVTESSAMLMPDIVNVFMGDLHRRGISFALDDFGAGFTAFRFFRDFQFDIVKIDGQFIRDIHKDADNQVLTAALIAIAHQFDMFTVAECVEKKEELAYLQEAGIDCLQGYLLGRPETVPVWKEDETSIEGYL
ncbi:EAL domain-containing protein [Neptunicoccus cionae]|uniref:EAL domain-containing protein n=1 Tax=Neptunicoccus cionae TaxID=2035344 RepID=UPI0026A1FB06